MPELIEYLRQHGHEYDRILFWTYRYYQTFFGLPLVADRAILVPTAEEDPLIWVDIVDRLFSLPMGYLFLTPEEAELVRARSSRPLAPSAVIGCGVDPAPPHVKEVDLSAVGVSDPFILYLGRIEPNKGCESLSMVLLEAWNQGLPALVNGRCAVLHGQVVRANGGLSYRYASEFAASLTYLLTHADVARRLGRQGLAYIEQEYRWPHVMRKVEDFLCENVARSITAPAAV